MKFKNNDLNRKITKYIVFVILTIIFCIPFFNGQIRVGADTTFHMNRIESLKNEILKGNYYPYIYSEQNYNYGYGTPSFYGQLFLYPAALLRICGVSLPMTWRLFIGIIIFVSLVSISYAYKKITYHNTLLAEILVGVIYVFNPFILSRVYIRGAIGELLALSIIPFVATSIHEFIYENNRKSWLKLGISFSLLLQAHNISFIIMCLVFVCMLIVNIKIIIKSKIIELLKAIVFALCLSAFFIFPMLEQFSTGIYAINNFFTENESLVGANIIDYISMIDKGGNYSIGIGLFLIIGPIVYLLNKGSVKYLSVIGLSLLLLSSIIFPWNYVDIFKFIQFPARFITIALSYLSIASIESLFNNKNKVSHIFLTICLIMSLVISTISSINLFNSFGAINDNTTLEQIKTGEGLYGKDDIGFSYNIPELSGIEYLPVPIEYDYSWNQVSLYSYSESGALFPLYYKDRKSINYIVNMGNDHYLVFPKTYYKGYLANIYSNGEYVTTLKTKLDSIDSKFVSVEIPEEYINKDIQVSLFYNGTIIQKCSQVLSLLSLYYLIFILLMYKKVIILKERRLSWIKK